MEPTQHLASASQVIPRQFYCPITRTVMLHPIVAPDGMSYERRAWQDWENRCVGPLRSPFSQSLIPRGRTVPNEMLRTLIADHPGTAAELEESKLEEDVWLPKPSRNEQLIKIAKAGGGAITSLFCGPLIGVVSGYIVGEVGSTLDPAHMFGPALRNYDRSFAVAQRGAQAGFLYGIAVAIRLLHGDDTNRYAVDRATRQYVGAHVGGIMGGIVGLAVGGLSWPLVCFALEICEALPFQTPYSIQAAQTLGCIGALAGTVVGLTFVAHELGRETQRRVVVRRMRA